MAKQEDSLAKLIQDTKTMDQILRLRKKLVIRDGAIGADLRKWAAKEDSAEREQALQRLMRSRTKTRLALRLLHSKLDALKKAREKKHLPKRPGLPKRK